MTRLSADHTGVHCRTDADGLPKWLETPMGFACGDAENQRFALLCRLHGFDLPEYDTWLSELNECEAKRGFVRRRHLAMDTFRSNNLERLQRHLEYLLTQRDRLVVIRRMLPAFTEKQRRSKAASALSDSDIEAALNRYGKKAAAARALGITERQLRNRLARIKQYRKS